MIDFTDIDFSKRRSCAHASAVEAIPRSEIDFNECVFTTLLSAGRRAKGCGHNELTVEVFFLELMSVTSVHEELVRWGTDVVKLSASIKRNIALRWPTAQQCHEKGLVEIEPLLQTFLMRTIARRMSSHKIVGKYHIPCTQVEGVGIDEVELLYSFVFDTMNSKTCLPNYPVWVFDCGVTFKKVIKSYQSRLSNALAEI